MYLQRTELIDFRNYTRQTAEFSPRVNVFFGDNAQGKTNLVESIYYFGFGKSFRAAADKELVRYGQPGFRLNADMEGLSFPLNPSRIEITYNGAKKIIKVDGVVMRRQADLVGLAKMVLFSPDDLQLIKGGPGNRRQFLDNGLAQCSSKYRDNLLRYNLVLASRNRFLRDTDRAHPDSNQLEAWDEQLVAYGSQVFSGRMKAVSLIAPLAEQFHCALSRHSERITVTYGSHFIPGIQPEGTPDYCAGFRKRLNEIRSAELARGVTLVGPHRDDLSLCVDNREMRLYASQGQTRTAVLALKMAMVRYIHGQTGDFPLLLLDDVLSEFDDHRKAALLETAFDVTQTFLTTTTPGLVSRFHKECRFFRVEQGVIRECPDYPRSVPSSTDI